MDLQSSTHANHVTAQSSNAQDLSPPRGQGDIEMGIVENAGIRATATDEGMPQRRTTTDTVASQLYSDRIIPMVPEFFQRLLRFLLTLPDTFISKQQLIVTRLLVMDFGMT
jgi:hypothetical protein